MDRLSELQRVYDDEHAAAQDFDSEVKPRNLVAEAVDLGLPRRQALALACSGVRAFRTCSWESATPGQQGRRRPGRVASRTNRPRPGRAAAMPTTPSSIGGQHAVRLALSRDSGERAPSREIHRPYSCCRLPYETGRKVRCLRCLPRNLFLPVTYQRLDSWNDHIKRRARSSATAGDSSPR